VGGGTARELIKIKRRKRFLREGEEGDRADSICRESGEKQKVGKACGFVEQWSGKEGRTDDGRPEKMLRRIVVHRGGRGGRGGVRQTKTHIGEKWCRG